MNSPQATYDVSLEPRALFSVPDAAGVRIACRDGRVWITLDHDLRDIVLEAGEQFSGTAHSRALVYALKPSRLAVSCADAQVQPRCDSAKAAAPVRDTRPQLSMVGA